MIEINEWVGAMADATIEFAEQMMDLPGGIQGPPASDLPSGFGSYIALVGDTCSLQLGVSADEATCYNVGRSLLMMEPDEELSSQDMADAMNEVINVVAGGVKTRMGDRESGLTLGLPMFIEGNVKATQSLDWAAGTVTLSPHNLTLVVLRQPK